MRDVQVKAILCTLIFIQKLDCSEVFDKGYTYEDPKDVIYEEEFNEPSSSKASEINPKLLEQTNTNVGDIADNYFILFKKSSDTEDDIDVEDDTDVVDDDDEEDVVLDSFGGDIRGGSSGGNSEATLPTQSTSKATIAEHLQSTTSSETASTSTSSSSYFERKEHFDSVNGENAFAETTENNILKMKDKKLKTRKERDEDEDKFSSPKGYYHFTGNRLPPLSAAASSSSSLSTSSSTSSTSSNYTKVGVTNQNDMVDSAFERHKAYRRNNKKYGHKSHKKKHKDYWKYGQDDDDEKKSVIQYPYYLGRQMSYYYPSTKGRHSIDIIKSNGHRKHHHHKQLKHHHLHRQHQRQNEYRHHNLYQYNQYTHPIYQYKRWSYDKGVEEFIPPYVKKYNRRNKQLINLLKGERTKLTTTTVGPVPEKVKEKEPQAAAAISTDKRRRNHQKKHHYHSHKNPKWLIEDLFEEQKANPNNPNANNENQYYKRRTTTKSAMATTIILQTTTPSTTTATVDTARRTKPTEPPVDDDFKLLVQNDFPGEEDVSLEMDGHGAENEDAEDSWQQEIEKSYGNQNSLEMPSIRRSHLGKTFEILYEKTKEMKNQTVAATATPVPVHQFFYHRIDAPRTVGVGETGRKQRLPFVAITDRRLEPSKLLAASVSKRENNILP